MSILNVTIQEYLKDPSINAPDIISEYLHGQCDVFAIATNKVFGWPIYSILEYRDIPEDGCMTALVHSFNMPNIKDKNIIFDAKGIRNISSLNCEYDYDIDAWLQETTESELRRILFTSIKNQDKKHRDQIKLRTQERIDETILFIKSEYNNICNDYIAGLNGG